MASSPEPSEFRPAPRSLQDILDLVHRHRIRALQVFLGVLGLTILGLVVAPRAFQSEAKLFVRVGRESIGLDPTATTAQTISVSDSREFEMNSVMDVIDSRAVLERVVDTLGADVVVSGRVPKVPPTAAITPVPAPAEPGDPMLREQAIRELADSIRTKSSKRSSVISISCKSSSPETAQHFLRTFLDSFQALHMHANRVTGSHSFFEEQCRLQAEELKSATHELSRAKSTIGLTSLEGRQKTLEDQVSAIQSAAVKNATALASSEATIRSLRETLGRLPDKVVTQEVTGFPEDAVGATRRHVADLKLKEQEMLVRFTAQHPYVSAIRQQIVSAERALANPDPEIRQATRSSNPNRDQLHLRLLSEEATAAALRAEATSLREQSKFLRDELELLNSNDSEITRLQQRVDVLKSSLKGYTEKLEQARIDQALASESISNVSVVQPATYSPKPVSPKKSLVLAAGLVVAVLSALGTIVACEYVRPELLTMPFRPAPAPSVG